MAPERTGPAARALLAVGLLQVAVAARADADAALARRLLAEGAILPLQSVIERAHALHPGTLIDADLRFEQEHRGYIYEVHILDADGVVWELELDAADGGVVEHPGENDH
jgi:uncharacterized membrane protein YkoI